MNYAYRVVHSPDDAGGSGGWSGSGGLGSSGHSNPSGGPGAAAHGLPKQLTLAQVFVHYSHFCRSFVEHCSSHRDFIATCHADRYKENGLLVTIGSAHGEAQVRAMLASFLAVTNQLAPGLCLVIEPVMARGAEADD